MTLSAEEWERIRQTAIAQALAERIAQQLKAAA